MGRREGTVPEGGSPPGVCDKCGGPVEVCGACGSARQLPRRRPSGPVEYPTARGVVRGKRSAAERSGSSPVAGLSPIDRPPGANIGLNSPGLTAVLQLSQVVAEQAGTSPQAIFEQMGIESMVRYAAERRECNSAPRAAPRGGRAGVRRRLSGAAGGASGGLRFGPAGRSEGSIPRWLSPPCVVYTPTFASQLALCTSLCVRALIAAATLGLTSPVDFRPPARLPVAMCLSPRVAVVGETLAVSEFLVR